MKKDKNPPIIYLTKDTFPKDFVWLTPVEFVFGKYGSISFRDGTNDNRDVFQLLTDAKGEEVRVLKISKLINKNGNQTRVILNSLSHRLQKDQKLAPFMNIIPTNEGAYSLAIKANLLKQ